MAWHDDNFRRRTPLTIDNPGTTPIDVTITIPPEWDAFWDTIDADGEELRFVTFDGQTVLSYAVDDGAGGAFVAADRVGRIQIDGMSVPTTASMLCIWLYWDPATPVGDGAVAVVIASARSGYIEHGRPGQHRFAHRAQTPRSTKPRDKFHKTVLEQVYVWVRLDHALQKRHTPGRGGARHEEPLLVTMTVQNSSAADQATMYDLTQCRFVETPRGEMWLRARVKAGTTATNYTIVLLIRTILPGNTSADALLETRIGVAVRDTLDS